MIQLKIVDARDPTSIDWSLGSRGGSEDEHWAVGGGSGLLEVGGDQEELTLGGSQSAV